MTLRIIRDLLVDDSGATLVEYAIVVALLSAVGLAGMTGIAGTTSNVINNQQTGFDTIQTLP
jgi:Flp pilus assembly pilin Flp